MAQTRLCHNLGIAFPSPPDLSDAGALAFAREQISKAQRLTGRTISVSDETITRHYRNRGVLPLDIAQDLSEKEQEAIRQDNSEGLSLRAIYVRHYPHGKLAAHLIGYAGREGRPLDGPLQNNDLLWPEAAGREGLEMTFNDQLTGKLGQMSITIDASGKKVSEKVSIPPEAGYNIVTTLDLNIQRLCEKALSEGARKGAIVVVDPNDGSILAMASWPSYDPNLFIPAISTEDFKALNEHKDLPLIPRAFRSAYPAGSAFKVFTGLAAIEAGKITVDQKFSGPASMQIGNIVMRNWKKTDAGMLTFAQALEQSCDTWFYQVAIKTGSQPLIDWALRYGFGSKTGIPLRAEAEGRIPDNDYMRKTHGRRLLDGDLANFSIGQGDILVTPLQMAQAMGIIANGGMFYQTRLVQQVQGLDNRIIAGYNLRVRDEVDVSAPTMAAIKKGLIDATSGSLGTGGRAAVPYVKVAGKTSTAQWGPKNNERYAAWYAGWAPADNPKYAFAVIYESEPKEETAHGGTVAAPIMGKVLRELFKEESKANAPKRKKGKKEKKAEPAPTPVQSGESD
jgi:penicillin-binding protein 2